MRVAPPLWEAPVGKGWVWEKREMWGAARTINKKNEKPGVSQKRPHKMKNAELPILKYFAMDLECLRARPEWREIAQGVLFQKGDIVEPARRPRKKRSWFFL